jgi:hypothetical protein
VLVPEEVVVVIVQAVAARGLETHYKIGLVAEHITSTRRIMSGREWDAVFHQYFGLPTL